MLYKYKVHKFARELEIRYTETVRLLQQDIIYI